MSGELLIVLIVLGGLIFGKLAGIRKEAKRIADVLERADLRAAGRL